MSRPFTIAAITGMILGGAAVIQILGGGDADASVARPDTRIELSRPDATGSLPTASVTTASSR